MGGKGLNGDIVFDLVVVKQLGAKLESQNRKLSFHTFEKKVLLTTVSPLKFCVKVPITPKNFFCLIKSSYLVGRNVTKIF